MVTAQALAVERLSCSRVDLGRRKNSIFFFQLIANNFITMPELAACGLQLVAKCAASGS
jgi:hypothetical protein